MDGSDFHEMTHIGVLTKLSLRTDFIGGAPYACMCIYMYIRDHSCEVNFSN